MGNATIFAGSKIKALKSTMNLNGGADVISSTTDPTSSAVSAEPGSLLLNTSSGKLYRKNDSGSSTNWTEVGASGQAGINYVSNPSAATNTTGWSTYFETDSVTFQDTGDTVTLNGHTLKVNDQVAFTVITSTTGIVVNTRYFVVNTTTNTFQLADTAGGAAKALTTNGSGTMVRFVPKVGTGGTANVTWTRSTSTPLRGAADFEFAKDAASRMGQGVSTDLTIDLADQAKVLTVTFDYELVSGTYADGDVTVYLIADPSGTPIIIQPAGYIVQSSTAGTKMRQIATFQTQATGQSYRLCFHVSSVSASAYTLALDTVVVGPQVVQYGAPVTDWQTVTLSISGGGGTGPTVTGKARRVGDNYQLQGTIVYGTSPAASTLVVALPGGISMDTGKMSADLFGGSTRYRLGWATYYDASTAVNYAGVVARDSDTALRFYSADQSVANPWNTTNLPVTAQVSDVVNFFAEFPVAGWSSTVQMSNDTDTRVVAAGAYRTSTGQSITAGSSTEIVYNTVRFDTHGTAQSSSTGRYTALVPGYYRVTYNNIITTGLTAASAVRMYILKNNTGGFLGATNNEDLLAAKQYFFCGSAIVQLNAGDFVSVICAPTGQAVTVAETGSNNDQSAMYVERLSGPSAIAASETVAMRAYKTSGAHTSSANWQTVASWDASPFDTHGGFSTSAGEYTCPVSGTYQVSSCIGFASNATGVRGVRSDLNGSVVLGGNLITTNNGVTTLVVLSGLIRASAGQKISLSSYQNSTANLNYDATGSYTHLSIVRVGN